jgi:tetratricopeptide (TPR) repeat protein
MSLLSLVMIVKDEARAIRATIASVRPFVDRYTILDTGSTDGTQELARQAFDDLPGEVASGPFVDFATTRNRALDLAGDQSTFTLMLSGDEVLVGGASLRAFCEEHRDAAGLDHGAYHVQVRLGGLAYDSARLARAGAGWSYEGVTHEVLRHPERTAPTIRVPGALIEHDVSHRDPAQQRRRWQLDRKLLVAEHRRRPDHARTLFYLAQTLDCLGDHAGALGAYERRAGLKGWPEEVFLSLLRAARCAEALRRPWPEVQQRYLDAHAHSPHRAEPLYHLAWHYYERQQWPLAYLFARRGAEIPLPEASTLFVEPDIYLEKLPDLVATAAYYVGEFAVGEAALRQALARRPDDPRLLRNLAFYEQRRPPAG